MNHGEPVVNDLVHVHQCLACGRYSLPEDFSARDTVRGLFECPFCHSCGALNVQIVRRFEVDRKS
jgi:hypothetical protein